jgi:hypothetical protein
MRFIYLIIIFLQTSIEEGNGCAVQLYIKLNMQPLLQLG